MGTQTDSKEGERESVHAHVRERREEEREIVTIVGQMQDDPKPETD